MRDKPILNAVEFIFHTTDDQSQITVRRFQWITITNTWPSRRAASKRRREKPVASAYNSKNFVVANKQTTSRHDRTHARENNIIFHPVFSQEIALDDGLNSTNM